MLLSLCPSRLSHLSRPSLVPLVPLVSDSQLPYSPNPPSMQWPTSGFMSEAMFAANPCLASLSPTLIHSTAGPSVLFSTIETTTKQQQKQRQKQRQSRSPAMQRNPKSCSSLCAFCCVPNSIDKQNRTERRMATFALMARSLTRVGNRLQPLQASM